MRYFSADGELLGYVGDSLTSDEIGRMTNAEVARTLDLSTLVGPHGTVTDSDGAVRGRHRQRDRSEVRANR